MKPKRIILVRHGQSQGNVNPNLYASVPDHRVGLTDRGRKQAYEAGLKIADIIGTGSLYAYTSAFRRAQQTLDGIETGLWNRFSTNSVVRTIIDPRLREQEWGNYRTYEECKAIENERDSFGHFFYRFSNGESGADVYDRISSFLSTMYRDFDKEDYPENALIVTHGFTLRIFLMRWFHWSVDHFEDLHNPKNCQIVVMKQVDGKYFLASNLAKRSDGV